MDLALQRCRTAREAIHFIDEILAEYGYASSGESISIADTTVRAQDHSTHRFLTFISR